MEMVELAPDTSGPLGESLCHPTSLVPLLKVPLNWLPAEACEHGTFSINAIVLTVRESIVHMGR